MSAPREPSLLPAYSICCACFEDRGLEKEPTPRGDDWWYPHASLASNLDLLLLDLAASGYNEWTEERLEALILDVLQLRSRREEADYRPERKPSITDALDAWNKAGTVMVALRPLIEVDEHA